MGMVGAAAWPLSSLDGRHFGMGVITGTVALASGVAGNVTPTPWWDLVFVLGIPWRLGGRAEDQAGELDLRRRKERRSYVHWLAGLSVLFVLLERLRPRHQQRVLRDGIATDLVSTWCSTATFLACSWQMWRSRRRARWTRVRSTATSVSA